MSAALQVKDSVIHLCGSSSDSVIRWALFRTEEEIAEIIWFIPSVRAVRGVVSAVLT